MLLSPVMFKCLNYTGFESENRLLHCSYCLSLSEMSCHYDDFMVVLY